MKPGDPRKLAALCRVADAVWQAEQARLGALAAEERRLRDRLAELEAGRTRRGDALRDGPDAARLAGVDPRWETWIDRRADALATDLARLLAAKEAARLRFARATGRKYAAEDLLARARARPRRD